MSLQPRTMSAGRWTAASAFSRSGLQLLQMVVLARLLLPADFGVMAIVVALLAVVSLIADFGISRTIIYFDEIEADALSSLYWLNVGIAITLAITVAMASSIIAEFYSQTRLVPVLLATVPVIVATAIGQQFCVLAEKDLRFATLAQNEIIAGLAGFTACVAGAVAGAGVYALVAGALTTASVGSLLAWWRLAGEHRPRLHFRWREARPYLGMGSYLVGENATSTLVRQADIFIGGLFATPAALGLFSLPRDLSLRVALVVNPIVTRVGFPVMARLKHDRARLRAVYLQTLRITASVNFPIYVVLGLFAAEFVHLFYGPRWSAAVELLRILAAWGLVRSVGNPMGSLLYAIGNARHALWWNLGQLALLPLTYLIAARAWGITGLAIALAIAQVALIVPAWWLLVRPSCGATLREYLSQITAPLVASAFAGILAWGITRNLEHGTVRLALGGITGGIAYLFLSYWLNRHWVETMATLLHLDRMLPASRR